MVLNTTLYPQESKYLWQITRRATDCPESLYYENKRLKTIGQWYFGYLPFRELSFPNATTLQSGAFYAATSLVSLTLPWSSITTIPIQCFQNCYLLNQSINLPNCTTIGSSAFLNCSNITYVEGSNVTSIYNYAFSGCTNLIEAKFISQLTFSGNYFFDGCTNLQSVTLGCAHILRQYMFRKCTKLTDVSAPKATGADVMCFNSCTALQTLYLPFGTYAYQSAFQDCSALGMVVYTGATVSGTISANAFLRCRTLLSLYLLGSLVKPLANVNAFASTPISTYTTYTDGQRGSIFVPSSLYATYIASTNWTTYSARFVSMTDQEIEDFLSSL